jgi:hypothetical protein
MSLLQLVQSAAGMPMVDEDGEVDRLSLLPGLTSRELEQLAQRLPCPIPTEVHDLLAFTRGFENGPLESVCFAGMHEIFDFPEIFPHPLTIAHDGFGNYWVVDLHAHSTQWGPILYVCHDPPVIVMQSGTLQHFIKEVSRLANPPHASELNDVHEQATSLIWAKNPGATPATELRESTDETLRAFATSLDDSCFVVDLRAAKLGDGFSWRRFGPRTHLVRYQSELLFAYQSITWWQRLLRG